MFLDLRSCLSSAHPSLAMSSTVLELGITAGKQTRTPITTKGTALLLLSYQTLGKASLSTSTFL